MKKSILSAKEAQILENNLVLNCEAAKVIQSALNGDIINPDDWTKPVSDTELMQILFKVREAYNNALQAKHGTTKDRNTEFKAFKNGLKHIASARKILMLDIKKESGKSNALTVELMKHIEKTLDKHYLSLQRCKTTERPILTTDINGKALQYMDKNVFALVGNLNFIEALKQSQNSNGYNITLLRNLYERFNELPFSKHYEIFGKSYELNTIFSKEDFTKEDFNHVCSLYDFDTTDGEVFGVFAGMGKKVLAKMILNFYPFFFDKYYQKFVETFKDAKGEAPGKAFENYVKTLEFSNFDAFKLALKDAKQDDTLSDVKASIFNALEGEIKETPKVDKAAKAEADKAAEAEADKAAKERENKLANLLTARAKCIEQREKLAKSKSKDAAKKITDLNVIEVKIQDELNELQGLNAPLNPAKTFVG